MRDSMLFSALPRPSDDKGFHSWIMSATEEFTSLLQGNLPYFIGLDRGRVQVVFDNIDLGVVEKGGAIFLPKQDMRREYRTTPAGRERSGVKIKGILSAGGFSYEEVSLVCRNGFESIFIPSKEKAARYSIEHKATVVTWDNGHFVDYYFDSRSVIERIFSAITLLESVMPELSVSINEDDPRDFIEELRYVQRTKLKKGGRRYDLAEGIFEGLTYIESYEVLLGAAIDVRYFIKSLLGDSQYSDALKLFQLYADCAGTPFFYFFDYNVLRVCCYIMRHADELVRFIGGNFQARSRIYTDATPDKHTRDSARSLSRQARMAMWYAELAKNNGAGVFCDMCGKKLEFTDFEVDHIMPWSKGGKTEPPNLRILCKNCNLKKGARIDWEADA